MKLDEMKVGLVLSGGGARGAAHLGILKALEEANVKIGYLSGTSVGSIVAVLFAYGYSPDEILKRLTNGVFKSIRPSLSGSGLLTLEPLAKELKKLIPENSFSSLSIPVAIAATNISTGRVNYFTEGPLNLIVSASCCVPGIFKPVKVGEQRFVDGGITDNLPARPLRDKCDYIVASHSNPIYDQFVKTGIRSIIERSLLIAINGNTIQSKSMCDWVIEPPDLGKFGGSELKYTNEIFQIGYSFAKANMPSDIFR